MAQRTTAVSRFNLFVNRAKHAVDEPAGILAAETLGKLNRFVDGDFWGHLGAVAEKKLDDYAKALNAGALKSQGDVLDLAARLELGATNAYLGVIPSLGNKDLAKVAARLAADETMHFTVLTSALGRPLPAGALSYGA